jgi:PAS domain S-box-containing protein
MQYQKVIEKLGYSPREAKVYLASLRMGEAHISDIAEKVNMPRTSVQAIMDRLHADGLVNFYVMRRYKYWVAENPKHILFNLQKKEEILLEAIPALTEIRKMARRKSYNKNSEEVFTRVVNCLSSAVQPTLVADDDCAIQYVNHAWEQLFGYTLQEVKGKETKLLSSGNTDPEVYQNMWRCLNKRHMFQSNKIIDKKKDGSIFSMQTTIFSVKLGETYFFVQILEEIEEVSGD